MLQLTAAHRQGDLRSSCGAGIQTPKLLIIDEVGYLPFSRDEASHFFQAIAHRYERGSLIITSKRPFRPVGYRSSPAMRRRRQRCSIGSCTTPMSPWSAARATDCKNANGRELRCPEPNPKPRWSNLDDRSEGKWLSFWRPFTRGGTAFTRIRSGSGAIITPAWNPAI